MHLHHTSVHLEHHPAWRYLIEISHGHLPPLNQLIIQYLAPLQGYPAVIIAQCYGGLRVLDCPDVDQVVAVAAVLFVIFANNQYILIHCTEYKCSMVQPIALYILHYSWLQQCAIGVDLNTASLDQ